MLLLLLLLVVVIVIVVIFIVIIVVIIVAIIVIVILDNEFAGPESSEDEELCSRLRQNIQHKKLSRTRKCRLSKKIGSMLRLVLNEADINSDEELAVLTSAKDKLDDGKKYLNSLKKDRETRGRKGITLEIKKKKVGNSGMIRHHPQH